MEQTHNPGQVNANKPKSIFGLLGSYRGLLFLLVVLAVLSSGTNLLIPKIISSGIDAYTAHTLSFGRITVEFLIAGFGILIFTYLQSIVQTYASERVGRDMRTKFAGKISRGSYQVIEQMGPSKLLTNLTSDIDAVKMFVSQAVVQIISSLFVIIGTSVLLIMINRTLALVVLGVVPLIAGAFFLIMGRIRPLFLKTRENIDWLNRIINESILGAPLIRVLNSQEPEYGKFLEANTSARDLGMQILRLFATMIPIIMFVSNLAIIAILLLGGHLVIGGNMTLGQLAAFNSYLMILIFPIMIIGFMTNVIARAQAAYGRVAAVLDGPETKETGTVTTPLNGALEVKDLDLQYGERAVLKTVSFSISKGSRTAIIGPTAAGKTQLLYVLAGLIRASSGTVEYDGIGLEQYSSEVLHRQVGLVFQDSIMFNMTLRENIAFSDTVTDESLNKAIATAELTDFIESLPEKLNTVVSERGTSLSGGQKQRIMLARALALQPKVLLLDDFTARVDTQTEQNILKNLEANYPGLTLISVTQKVASVEHYDQIIVLMEGEVLARGTHERLMHESPEYVQIYNSQRSTNQYELQT